MTSSILTPPEDGADPAFGPSDPSHSSVSRPTGFNPGEVAVHERGDNSFPCAPGVVGYRAGLDRNEERALSHTYAMMADGELWPMCGYGWNRSGGHRFSILRQYPGTEGNCRLCRKNVATGKPPVMDGFPHKTKWL